MAGASEALDEFLVVSSCGRPKMFLVTIKYRGTAFANFSGTFAVLRALAI